MPYLLTLNAGSSSVKFRLFDFSAEMPVVLGGKVIDIGNQPQFSFYLKNTPESEQKLPATTTEEQAIEFILNYIEEQGFTIDIAAHRVVHGGRKYAAPCLLDDQIFSYLKSLEPLAPLHQPHNLSAVEILRKKRADMPQYACFDTAFHAGQEPLFYEFALPENLRDKGVRRYGFHGLSYDFISQKLKTEAPHLYKGKTVVAHLGNGASLCALKAGKSIDTTMGMTALDGLPMGTRCGAIDAGAIIYLEKTLNYSIEELEHLLYEESGLKGLSGLTNDVKALSESLEERATFALNYFSLKTAQYVAHLAVSLKGLDGLVFTGGIGENSALVRNKIVEHLNFLPSFEVRVIPTNEELCMAQEIWNLQ